MLTRLTRARQRQNRRAQHFGWDWKAEPTHCDEGSHRMRRSGNITVPSHVCLMSFINTVPHSLRIYTNDFILRSKTLVDLKLLLVEFLK
jgi:hypothetical protein